MRAADRLADGPVPLVSVVIPARDAARWLGRCLDALGAQRTSPNHEVIVIDNGSTDETAAIAARHPAVDQVLSEPRPGSYIARNRGIDAARGAVLAFTDADCVPDRDWLVRGCEALVDADLAGGDIVGMLGDDRSMWELYDVATYLDQGSMIRGLSVAATANLFVHRRVIDAIGAFDPDLVSSGDAEFTRRAVERGFRLTYAAAAVVEHRSRATLAETWRLHHRLGAGWAVLARRGQWPPAWRDPAMRVPLDTAVAAILRIDPSSRRGTVLIAWLVASTARWSGRTWGWLRGVRSTQTGSISRGPG